MVAAAEVVAPRRRRIACALLALGIATVGCSGDDGPPGEGSSTAADTSSSVPGTPAATSGPATTRPGQAPAPAPPAGRSRIGLLSVERADTGVVVDLDVYGVLATTTAASVGQFDVSPLSMIVGAGPQLHEALTAAAGDGIRRAVLALDAPRARVVFSLEQVQLVSVGPVMIEDSPFIDAERLLLSPALGRFTTAGQDPAGPVTCWKDSTLC